VLVPCQSRVDLVELDAQRVVGRVVGQHVRFLHVGRCDGRHRWQRVGLGRWLPRRLRLPALLPLAALLAALGGVWSINAARVEGDPGWVVIDEFAGQWLALCGLAHASLPGLLAAFIVFRILDVAKPGPIGWADRQGGAAGIMADDLIAGAITAGILWAIRSHWPGLLG